MASRYHPKDKKNWYIGYVDPITGKSKSRSTRLLATNANIKKAELYKKEIEELIAKKKKELGTNNIQRASINQAYKHFLKINYDKSDKTKQDYKRFYQKLIEKFKPSDPCLNINKLTAENWILEIKQLDVQKNTVYNYFKVFNKFLNFYSGIFIFFCGNVT